MLTPSHRSLSLSRIFSFLDIVTLCRCAQISKVEYWLVAGVDERAELGSYTLQLNVWEYTALSVLSGCVLLTPPPLLPPLPRHGTS